MILNTGNRTDIPAFYSQWFFNRLREGYVDVLNTHGSNVNQRTYWRYQINPDVVDVIAFCTKNPAPMLSNKAEMDYLLSTYATFWNMTITPYGQDVEPYVPDLTTSVQTFRALSERVGAKNIGWRYDPIFFGNGWNISWHIRAFTDLAKSLEGYTQRVTISFLDEYTSVYRNAGFAMRPYQSDQSEMVRMMTKIAAKYGMQLYICHDDNPTFETDGAIVTGCATVSVINAATGLQMVQPKTNQVRNKCSCALNSDIGAYNTCIHGCKYCYANDNEALARLSYAQHAPDSSCLIGRVTSNDIIVPVNQESWIGKQIPDDEPNDKVKKSGKSKGKQKEKDASEALRPKDERPTIEPYQVSDVKSYDDVKDAVDFATVCMSEKAYAAYSDVKYALVHLDYNMVYDKYHASVDFVASCVVKCFKDVVEKDDVMQDMYAYIYSLMKNGPYKAKLVDENQCVTHVNVCLTAYDLMIFAYNKTKGGYEYEDFLSRHDMTTCKDDSDVVYTVSGPESVHDCIHKVDSDNAREQIESATFLDSLEKLVIIGYYFDNKVYREIGQENGITIDKVRSIKSKALTKLRKYTYEHNLKFEGLIL